MKLGQEILMRLVAPQRGRSVLMMQNLISSIGLLATQLQIGTEMLGSEITYSPIAF